jgi:hypothetical protein
MALFKAEVFVIAGLLLPPERGIGAPPFSRRLKQ